MQEWADKRIHEVDDIPGLECYRHHDGLTVGKCLKVQNAECKVAKGITLALCLVTWYPVNVVTVGTRPIRCGGVGGRRLSVK
jgi:hypothetical protein